VRNLTVPIPPLSRNCEREDSVIKGCPPGQTGSLGAYPNGYDWEDRRKNSPQARKLWYAIIPYGVKHFS